MVIMASTAAGMSCGRSVRIVFKSCVNSWVTVSRRDGSRSAKAVKSASVTVGRTLTIFSMTGVTFRITFWRASTMFWQSISISASALPKPTSRFCSAACRELMEPEMVFSASAAVAPATPILFWIAWIA